MSTRFNLRTAPRSPLTPEALETLERIARTGSFAGAAREMGKVPSALTYSMRALEDALDVLLFDRSSRQARLTPAGEELLREGRRLLRDLDALATRVKRVATGWEGALTIAFDGLISQAALLDLTRGFYAMNPPTRLTLREEILAGTWEALISGAADLAIGVTGDYLPSPGIEVRTLGPIPFVFVCAPHHALAAATGPVSDDQLMQQRAVAVSDSARDLVPKTVNLLPGQPVLTVSSLRLKVEAIEQGLGCGWLPEPTARDALQNGRLISRQLVGRGETIAPVSYAWRAESALGGRAQAWWLTQLDQRDARLKLLGQSRVHQLASGKGAGKTAGAPAGGLLG